MGERVPSLGGKIFLNPSVALRPSLSFEPTHRRVHYNAKFFPQPQPKDKILVNPNFLTKYPNCVQKNDQVPRVEPKIHFNPYFLEPEKCVEPPRPTVLLNPKFLSLQNTVEVKISPVKVMTKSGSLKLRTKHKLVRKHLSPTKPSSSTPTVTTKRLSKYKFIRTPNKVDVDMRPKKTPLRVLSKYSLCRVSCLPSAKPLSPKMPFKSPFSSPPQVGSVLRSHIVARRCSRLNNTLLLRKVLSPRGIMESVPGPSHTQKSFTKSNPDRSVYKLRKNRKQATRHTPYTPQKTKYIAKCKLKKDNQQCQIFSRFGRCKGKERGLCTKVHDPKYVALCKKFLKGECVESPCALSHLLIPEKMPTCYHYLAGRCLREGCLYAHVKHSSSAPICRQFLDGFCPKGTECAKRHEYLCPYIAEKGICPKGKKCIYPHPPTTPGPGAPKKVNRKKEPHPPPREEKLVAKEVVAVKGSTEEAIDSKTTTAPTSSRYFSKPGIFMKEGERAFTLPDTPQGVGEEEVEETTALALLKQRPTSPLPPFIPLPSYPSDSE